MSIESIISLVASLIAIGGAIWAGYKLFRRKPLTDLMNELADKNTSQRRQRVILGTINAYLVPIGHKISLSYISDFHAKGRSKLAIFYDICNENNIEPTAEICKKLVGADEPKFRKEWIAKHRMNDNAKAAIPKTEASSVGVKPASTTQVVYMSSLLRTRYPDTCKRLTDILDRHGISYKFLEGTKDIWCRDYMPVQTPSGKLVQFKYDPSYLKDPKYADSRSDVKHVDAVNNINPIFSDINLDGGNVVMFDNKAIITDRIFSENPDWTEENLKAELAKLLECEIIIIPAYKPEYDFTGHADGMMRFIDKNTVLVNNPEQDFKYMKDAIIKALDSANLKYVNFPWFEHKIKGNNDHAIGIYINYLEVGNLIVMPVFGGSDNKDAEALAKLKEVFPDKTIETIDYNDVAMAGGILNCTTWVIKQ